MIKPYGSFKVEEADDLQEAVIQEHEDTLCAEGRLYLLVLSRE